MSNVSLYVSTTAATGYTPTTASIGITYYYKYTGGSDGNGNVTETVGHPENIVVTLQTAGYSISDVTISNDPNNQLSKAVDSTTQATITDVDTMAESDAEYSVVLKLNSNPAITFDCDPRVSNEDEP